MRAMVLQAAAPAESRPLELRDVPVPEPAAGEVLVKVRACGVCRTDLHVVEGELPDPKLPLVPGHQVVGTVDRVGEGVRGARRRRARGGAMARGHGRHLRRTAAALTRISASTPPSRATSATAATPST